ncbi:DUF1833 family protein [Pseudescherichia vulneris]|uniref:DUF1833 family protein n=1 Tax=Pseudescherichia vulneris TaxID=566 RepID=UPI001EE0AC5D|nr:DUF1833 family protein [Pseudescherichia vulneris]WPO93753.1 DUF1833 family protein [Buttiauxella sp. HR94]
MTVLNRLYASGGDEVLIHTLQINIGEDVFYLTPGWVDIEAVTEAGEKVLFTACGIDIALPARNSDGTQDLEFAISNIEGVVSNTIRNALENIQGATLTYRLYTDDMLTAPAARPYTLKIRGGSWTPTVVQIKAGYVNVLDWAWPRFRFTLPDYPGLRYL